MIPLFGHARFVLCIQWFSQLVKKMSAWFFLDFVLFCFIPTSCNSKSHPLPAGFLSKPCNRRWTGLVLVVYSKPPRNPTPPVLSLNNDGLNTISHRILMQLNVVGWPKFQCSSDVSLFRFPRRHSHRIRGHRGGVTACRATTEADERGTRSGLFALPSVIVEFDLFFGILLAHCNDLFLGDFGGVCVCV